MKPIAVLVLLVACGDDGATSVDGQLPDTLPDACACTFGTPTAAGNVANATAIELSGLVVSRAHANTYWGHNDSGDTARVFAIGAIGADLGVSTITGATARDWEDLTLGPCSAGGGTCLYLGDIGDNDAVYPSVAIYEVPEPAPGSPSAAATKYELVYPGGPHNAEALFIDPRDSKLYTISKTTTNPAHVFEMPRMTGATATAIDIGMFSVNALDPRVTGADLIVDDCGVRLLVRAYKLLLEFAGPPGTTIAQLVASTPRTVPSATEPQGESVAWLPDGRGFVTVSEKVNAPTVVLSVARCQ